MTTLPVVMSWNIMSKVARITTGKLMNVKKHSSQNIPMHILC